MMHDAPVSWQIFDYIIYRLLWDKHNAICLVAYDELIIF